MIGLPPKPGALKTRGNPADRNINSGGITCQWMCRKAEPFKLKVGEPFLSVSPTAEFYPHNGFKGQTAIQGGSRKGTLYWMVPKLPESDIYLAQQGWRSSE